MKRGHVRLVLALSLIWAIAYAAYAVPWYHSARGRILVGEFEMAKFRLNEGVAVVSRGADGTSRPVLIGEFLNGMRLGEHRLRVPEAVAKCFADAKSPPSHFRLEKGDLGVDQLVVLDEVGTNLAEVSSVTYFVGPESAGADPANECASSARHKIADEEEAQKFSRRFALWRTMAWQFALGIVAIAGLLALGVWVLRGFAREPAK
jgi:hypothetical protein